MRAWNWKRGPQLRNSLLSALENGTNGNFGMGFSSAEAACLHDILFTLSSLSKKWSSANASRRKKSSLHADASAVESGLASVTRTDVGGHFCGIQHGRRARKQVHELLSRCPKKCIYKIQIQMRARKQVSSFRAACPNKCIFVCPTVTVVTKHQNKTTRTVPGCI